MARKNSLENITIDGKSYTLFDIECHDKKDVAVNTYTIKSVFGKIRRGEIDMHPLIQRTDNQWDSKRKSKLLMAIIDNKPIGNIVVAADPYGREIDGQDVNILVDGLQRLTTIRDFIDGKIKISKVDGFVNGRYRDNEDNNKERRVEINIGGYLFQQLPEFMRENFKNYKLTFSEYGKQYDQDEIEEVMFSLNNGAPFKPWQKVKTKLGMDIIAKLDTIIKETDWASVNGVVFKDGKCKNDATLGCIIKSMMLIDENNRGRNGLTMGAVDKYIISIKKSNSKCEEMVNEVKELFDDFNTIMGCNGAGKFGDFIDITTLPHIIASIKSFKEFGDLPFEKYVEFLSAFVNDGFDFDDSCSFSKFCNAKVVSKDYNHNIIDTKQMILELAMSNYFNSTDESNTVDEEYIANNDDYNNNSSSNIICNNNSTNVDYCNETDGEITFADLGIAVSV